MIGPSHPLFWKPQKIVAFSGYARAGKDEAARVLVKEYGFERRGFADKLREVLYALNPLIAPTPEKYFVNSKTPRRLRDVIDEYTWDGYKETEFGDEIRALLQRLGTEAGRNILGNNVWVDALFKDEYENLVIPDCRFPNEFDGVRQRGGKVVRIERVGVTAVNAHISETALDDHTFDATITNAGNLEEFREKIRDWVSTNV